MKILNRLLSTALAITSLQAIAQDGWRDARGEAVPDSPSSKSKDGFAAMLLVTSDKDWREKWNSSPDTVPHFSQSKVVASGGELFILSFLANPLIDASGMADVTCDFVVTRPDESKSINERNMPCFVTKLSTDPGNVYLSAASLTFVAEPEDPRGVWLVNVTLRDNVREVEIPLEASFDVE